MELVNLIKRIIRANLTLFIVLIILSITSGIVHYFLQSYNYVSTFQIEDGRVDYGIFVEFNDLELPTTTMYAVPEDSVERYEETLEKFRITFKNAGGNSINVKATAEIKEADHYEMQRLVVHLLNNNSLIYNSLSENRAALDKKIFFLEKKIEQLDSLMLNPGGNIYFSNIPSDSYFLFSELVNLKNEKDKLGSFDLMKPIIEVEEQRRPLILFLVLYLILGGFIFLGFAKKKQLKKN